MATTPTILLTDGKATIRVNESEKSEWLARLGDAWAVAGEKPAKPAKPNR
jgi:hypothetical protein